MMFSRRRRATSEAIGAILAIALTLSIGAALFGFVTSQAGTSEKQIGNAAQGNVAYLQERFVVPEVVFASKSLTIDVYNNGQIPDNIVQVEVYNVTSTKINISYDASYVTDLNNPACKQAVSTSLESPVLGTSSSSLSVKTGGISPLTLTLPSCYSGSFVSGVTYYVKLLGEYGNSVTYFQAM